MLLRAAPWMVVVMLAAGCAAEPAWEEGQIGELYEGISVGGAGGCSTFIVDGLSKQLIGEQNCIRPNALVSFAGKPGLSIGSNVYPYLEPNPANALAAVGQQTTVNITSAFRTLAQQYLLYKWYQTGQCGISLAATPGNSNHETGIAVDVGNYSSVLTAMQAHGWSHSYPSTDPVHYDYTAGGTVDLRHESVLAFQRLWNFNNPGDLIGEDGAYGPQTEAKLVISPAEGFAKGSTCAPPPPPPPAPQPQFAAEFVGQSMPTTLGAGESVAAWVEYKNTGTGTWTANTRLGTAEPHDRTSALVAGDWLGPNRATSVDATTAPGQVGRFSFTVQGPAVGDATALTEHFQLVEEGVTWFGPEASVDVEITTGGGGNGGGSGASGGCAIGEGRSRGRGVPAGEVALVAVMFVTLFWRRRASYSSGRCRGSAGSSSFWPSRSR
jgi:hypothetical protein